MIASKIRRRIRGKGRGAIWTASDFSDLGPRTAVDQALSRLADQDIIRRLAQGLYDFPKISPRLGALSPSLDAVAGAIARKDGRIKPGDLVMFEAMGGGFTWGASLMRV